jgi:hypothetical protein
MGSVAVKVNNTDAHFMSGISLPLIRRASVYTDLLIGYECRLTRLGGVSKLELYLCFKEKTAQR